MGAYDIQINGIWYSKDRMGNYVSETLRDGKKHIVKGSDMKKLLEYQFPPKDSKGYK